MTAPAKQSPRRPVLCLGVTIPGSTWLMRGQAAWFREQGFDVHLLCPEGPEAAAYCADEGCTHQVVRIARHIDPFKDIVTIWQLFRLFRRIRPDVVNVGTPKMGLLGTIAAFLARVPRRVFTCRGLRYEHESGILRRVLILTEWLSGLFAHHVVCIAPSVRARGVADGVFPSRKVLVIGRGSSNGVLLDTYTLEKVNQSERTELTEQHALAGKFVYGFVGRLVDRKGVNELVAAFARIYAEDSGVRLLLVGAADQSQMRDLELLARIQAHPGIVWTGFVSDVRACFSLMDVFVLPSWWEGFGNAYLEAASFGIPVIGTWGTGCRDAVSNGYNGMLVQPHDEDALLKAMIHYRRDKALRSEHGRNGLAWVKEFHPHVIWNGLLRLYKSGCVGKR